MSSNKVLALSLCLDAISANNIEMLETIITDENAMFDVLGDFFYHVNHQVKFNTIGRDYVRNLRAWVLGFFSFYKYYI